MYLTGLPKLAGVQVRVVSEGFARGLTILDRNLKAWNAPNAWTERPKVYTPGRPLVAVQFSYFGSGYRQGAEGRRRPVMHTDWGHVRWDQVKVATAVQSEKVAALMYRLMAADGPPTAAPTSHGAAPAAVVAPTTNGGGPQLER